MINKEISNSAILSMPPEARSAVMTAIRKPKFLARVLREEAESAEGWANAHADKTSYTHRKDANGNWITKHDSYMSKAKMLRDAANIFDPPNV